MSVQSGFDELQTTVNVPTPDLAEARRRRDLFTDPLKSEPDVVDVIPSGSLARGTHKDPIHDVDLIVVYDGSAHLEWGDDGPSALAALEHLRSLLKKHLGNDGTGDVRLTKIQNHSVKCFLDDPEDPNAFTVDVTPALVRAKGGFTIPEQRNDKWVPSDPEYLIELVADRHAQWNEFAKLVRVLKRWNTDHGKHMKSLVVEVLALHHLPEFSRSQALARFFAAAQVAIWSPVNDPAGLCGTIQPDLDLAAAADALGKAADLANRALEAEARNDTRQAQCLWNKVFGPIYPEPYLGCGPTGTGAAVVATAKRPVVDSPQG